MGKRIKRIMGLGIVGVVSALMVSGLVGCGNKHIDNKAMEKEFENAPEWVLVGHEPDTFSAVGSAKIGKSGMQFARTAALALARNELANRLSVQVYSLVDNVTRQAGMGDAQMVDRLGKQVSSQVARETLNGSMQKDIWISPGSDLYVLVVMDADAVKASVRNNMVSSFEEDADGWEEFRAGKGDELLDREIDQIF